MIYQSQRLIRDDRLELIFGGPGARHIGGASFGRNVVPPVPAQCVIIDRKVASSSLDRGTRRQKPLDPHTFRMITALASACGRPPSSRHYFPHDYTSKSNSTRRRMNRSKNSTSIAQNYGAVMTGSKVGCTGFEARSTPGFSRENYPKTPDCKRNRQKRSGCSTSWRELRL